MSKLANELALIRHMIDVGYPRKHAKNHIPPLVSLLVTVAWYTTLDVKHLFDRGHEF